jgi:hypothetical protein
MNVRKEGPKKIKPMKAGRGMGPTVGSGLRVAVGVGVVGMVGVAILKVGANLWEQRICLSKKWSVMI